MANKTYTLSLTGPAQVIDPLVESFALSTGWTPTIPDPANKANTITNPITQDEAVRRGLRDYMLQSIGQFNAKRAGMAARAAALAIVQGASEVATLELTGS